MFSRRRSVPCAGDRGGGATGPQCSGKRLSTFRPCGRLEYKATTRWLMSGALLLPGLFLPPKAASRSGIGVIYPNVLPLPLVSPRLNPSVVARDQRQQAGWVDQAVALRHPTPPAILLGLRDAADLDTYQLPRVLPQQARGPLHPLKSGCQLECQFPQDQCETEGHPMGRVRREAWGGVHRPPSCSFPLPQENEKSPSQNRKAKDATSDNGKGQETGPQTPSLFQPLTCATLASPCVWCLQMAWPTQPC